MRGALRSRLLSLSGVPTVLWEMETAETPPSTLHLRETLRIGVSQPISLGTPQTAATNEVLAQYLIEIFAPFPKLGTSKNSPTSAFAVPQLVAETWVDTLAQHFKPGTTLTNDGRDFVMQRSTPGAVGPRASAWAVGLVTIDLRHEFTSYT